MWQARVSRRELLEIVVSGKKFAKFKFDEIFSLDAALPLNRDVIMLWDVEPALRVTLPSIIIVDDSERDALFAQINSNPGGPSPLTAYCRVLIESEARIIFKARSNTGERSAIDALVGVSFCEAMIHSGGVLHPLDLSPAICKRTVAFAWCRGLANGLPASALEDIIDNWFESRRLCNGTEHATGMKFTVDSAIPIFRVATALFLGIPADNPILSLCEALIEDNYIDLQRHWRLLSARLSKNVSLEEISESAREERGAYLQFALASLSDSDDWINSALCAFLATRVSPGTFEHLEFLIERGGHNVAMWYCFFVGLEQPRGILGFFGGLGSRVARDITRTERVEERPTADVSLSELRVLARGGLDGMSRRLGHSNEIEVEIMPLLNCSFRFNNKSIRQQEMFEESSSDLTTATSSKLTPLSPSEQIESIIRALEDLGKSLPIKKSDQFKTAPRRVRRPAKL